VGLKILSFKNSPFLGFLDSLISITLLMLRKIPGKEVVEPKKDKQ
jgi:hypothetical protein